MQQMHIQRLTVHRRLVVFGAVALLLACGDPRIMLVGGTWHVTEALGDDIHQVFCTGTGTLTLTQGSVLHGATDPSSGASTAVTGSSGVDTDCVGLDGPFDYFGNGTITSGTAGPDNTIRWTGKVNEADCSNHGTVSGDGTYASELNGTMECTLVQPGVTFNFVGTWEARNWRSDWCATRRELPGCSAEG